MNPPPPAAFDFGENWSDYSAHALTPERVSQARTDFAALFAGIPLAGKSFLDIGFGQGLGLLIAASSGAHTHGCDINPKCADVLRHNLRHFPELPAAPAVTIGSILDPTIVERLRAAAPQGGFDLVHAWGSLHHTGDMAAALRNSAGLVAPGGHLIVALYNRHWTSPIWKGIKRAYVGSPRWLQRTFIQLLTPIIFTAKWLVTTRDPRQQERGMDFHYNVVDWVGGYPYEYASRAEVEALIAPLGFKMIRFRAATVPTGCNEFVLQRKT